MQTGLVFIGFFLQAIDFLMAVSDLFIVATGWLVCMHTAQHVTGSSNNNNITGRIIGPSRFADWT
jgi:hypothetical protein